MRLKAVTLTVALIFGGALASTTPAAAASAADCPSGKLCLFLDSNFGGEIYVPDSNRVSDLKGESYPGNYPPVNDSTSSVVNKTGQTVRLNENSGQNGRYIDIKANSQILNLKSNSFVIYNHDGSTNQLYGAFNDVISSFCTR